MLNKAKALKGFKLHSRDGDIGSIREFYFDDRHWMVRYLVAETGTWLSGRKVLISPHALLAVDTEKRTISVDLSRKQIEDSPSLESDKPVSRQFEESYFKFYGWPAYWDGPLAWGYSPYLVNLSPMPVDSVQTEKSWDAHLRSTHDVSGRDVQAEDGDIGHIEDFVIDDEIWAIQYLVINTQNWWAGKQVLVSPRWIGRIDWKLSKVFVNLSRDAVKHSPEYTPQSLIDRNYEAKLHVHYSRQPYWADEAAAKEMAGGGLGGNDEKELSTKAVNSRALDPNCGMPVDTSTNFKTEQEGKQFYFCSDHCMQKFLSLPVGSKP